MTSVDEGGQLHKVVLYGDGHCNDGYNVLRNKPNSLISVWFLIEWYIHTIEYYITIRVRMILKIFNDVGKCILKAVYKTTYSVYLKSCI